MQAELAEAQANLEDTYYERSVTNQQDALDKELENFQESKDKEMEGWDEYLENTEQVVSDSLATVQANTDTVYQTLQTMGQEYSLSITESLTSPWKDGAIAIQDFSEKFGLSMSSTVEELQKVAEEYKKVMDEIDGYGDKVVDKANDNAEKYVQAEKKEPVKEEEPVKKEESKNNTEVKALPQNGSTVKVKKTATHFGAKSGNKRMASFVPGSSYTVYGSSGSGNNAQILIGRNGEYTGWVNLKDLEGYAKGTTSLEKSGFIRIDELGDELLLGAKNGRLTYMEKGSGIIPADLTSNLMKWGELNPQDMLDRNRPAVIPSKYIVNNEINLDCSVGTMVNIEHCDQNTLPDVEEIVNKAFDKHMQNLNNSLKRYARS